MVRVGTTNQYTIDFDLGKRSHHLGHVPKMEINRERDQYDVTTLGDAATTSVAGPVTTTVKFVAPINAHLSAGDEITFTCGAG